MIDTAVRHVISYGVSAPFESVCTIWNKGTRYHVPPARSGIRDNNQVRIVRTSDYLATIPTR